MVKHIHEIFQLRRILLSLPPTCADGLLVKGIQLQSIKFDRYPRNPSDIELNIGTEVPWRSFHRLFAISNAALLSFLVYFHSQHRLHSLFPI